MSRSDSLKRAGLTLTAVALLSGCAGQTPDPAQDAGNGDAGETLVIYSGRGEDLVGPIIETYEASSEIPVEVRYGDTAEMAATILEEGGNSPADVYYGQDAGALGALAAAGRTQTLADETLAKVDERLRSPEGAWIGVTGRARVFAYNTDRLSVSDLPDTAAGFCEDAWRGRVGWAPTNGSYQAFVTALRKTAGDQAAADWLECMLANDVRVYANNSAIVEAVGSGDIDVGLVNHYYLYRFLAERPDFPVANAHPAGADASAMVNVSGAAIIDTTDNPAAAADFIDFLLGSEAQNYFSAETSEYPLAAGIPARSELKPLSEIATPDIDLSDLEDLQGTLDLLRDAGVL